MLDLSSMFVVEEKEEGKVRVEDGRRKQNDTVTESGGGGRDRCWQKSQRTPLWRCRRFVTIDLYILTAPVFCARVLKTRRIMASVIIYRGGL